MFDYAPHPRIDARGWQQTHHDPSIENAKSPSSKTFSTILYCRIIYILYTSLCASDRIGARQPLGSQRRSTHRPLRLLRGSDGFQAALQHQLSRERRRRQQTLRGGQYFRRALHARALAAGRQKAPGPPRCGTRHKLSSTKEEKWLVFSDKKQRELRANLSR